MPPTLRTPWRLALLALPLALALTACLPEGVRVPQSELSALLEPKKGLIAYLGVDGNVYTIDQGGGQQKPLTNDARQDDSGYFFYGMPAWSPDSKSLAFAAYSGETNQNPDHTYIYTAHSDGTQLTQALTTDNFLVFWSWAPDGQQVGYISQTPSNNLSFAVVPPSGGEAEIVDVGSPYYWSWAPTGHSLLVHAGGASPNANARVALLQLDSGVTEQVLDVKPAEFKNPAFSPDGQQVLLAVENDQGGSDLVVADALGGNARVITSYSGNIAFAWSPNGKRLAYILMDSPTLGTPGQLVVADPAGKAKPVELDDENGVYAFFWSPDSQSLAYFSEAPIEPEATPENAATATAVAQAAAGAPQLLNLEVMNAGNGSAHNVLTYYPTNQFMQLLPYFEQYHQSLTIWSPDSKNLVVSAVYDANGTPGIFVAAASGHVDPRFIVDGLVGVWSWK